MDWNKAKTLTIVFLLFLNAFLGFSIYLDRNKYNLSVQQLRAITELLSKNDIGLKTSIPRSYKPMRQLSMSRYEYGETEELLAMFFTYPASAERLDDEYDKVIYRSNEQTLTLQNGYITFDCPAGTNDIELNANTATAEALRFLKGKDEFTAFVPDGVFMSEEGCRLTFCQKYQNYIIYTNFIEFLITEKGIVQIDCIYSVPKGYFGQPAKICGVDEAMLHFMQYYKDAYKDQHADISKIDLVYYQKEGSTKDNDSLTAVPHYRISVEGFERPFLINAYLNRIEQF